MKIGFRIVQHRHDLGWSQFQLAQKIRTNTKSIKDWENDVSLPSLSNLIKLCNTFHTSADNLLGLNNKQIIYLDGLSIDDQKKIRAMMQAFMDSCERIDND